MKLIRQAVDETIHLLRDDVPSNFNFCRTMRISDGDYKGEMLDVTMHPAQHCLVLALDSGYKRFIVAKCVQDGGTLVGQAPFLLRAVKRGHTVLLAYPTDKAARIVWRTKLWPTIKAYGGQEPKSGGGVRGGVPDLVMLPGGGGFLMRSAGGRGESGQAIVTPDDLMVDEVDDWEDLHRIELITERLSKSPDPIAGYVSTVKADKDSKIITLWEEGTQTRLEYPCWNCGAFQSLNWEQVDVERELYICAHCKAEWTERQRLDALKLWKRHDAHPERRTFSILWTGLDSPFPITDSDGEKSPTMPGMCRMFKRAQALIDAKNDHSLMLAFNRDRLTRGYVEPPPKGEFGPPILAKRSAASTYHRGEVPGWVRFLTVGCDVQGDRHYWLCMGHGPHGRAAIIDWGYEYLTASGQPEADYEPTLDDRVKVMDTIAARCRQGWARQGVPHERLEPIWSIIDTGYHATEIYPWVASQNDWIAGKGVGSTPDGRKDLTFKEGTSVLTDAPELAVRMRGILDITQPKSAPIQLWHILGSSVRSQLQSGFKRASGTAGAIELPRELQTNNYLILHLTAEVYTFNPEKQSWYWRQARPGNHLGDCATYALAVGLFESAYQELFPPTPEPVTPPPQAPTLTVTKPERQHHTLQRHHTFKDR